MASSRDTVDYFRKNTFLFFLQNYLKTEDVLTGNNRKAGLINLFRNVGYFLLERENERMQSFMYEFTQEIQKTP